METASLHAAKEKVKIIKYYCIGASLSLLLDLFLQSALL
jgi:hypothetical protein